MTARRGGSVLEARAAYKQAGPLPIRSGAGAMSCITGTCDHLAGSRRASRPRRHRLTTSPEEPHEGSPSVDPAAPRHRPAGSAPGAEPGGFSPCDDDGARGDHRRRRRRDLVGGRGGGRDPRRHVGEAGSRGHPRAAADRRPGCGAHRLRGPVRRRASRSEGRLCRLRDHRGWRFGLRDTASGARADRRAGHGRGTRHRGGPGLSGEHHRFRDATGGGLAESDRRHDRGPGQGDDWDADRRPDHRGTGERPDPVRHRLRARPHRSERDVRRQGRDRRQRQRLGGPGGRSRNRQRRSRFLGRRDSPRR